MVPHVNMQGGNAAVPTGGFSKPVAERLPPVSMRLCREEKLMANSQTGEKKTHRVT